MLLKLALKRIAGNGWRSVFNILILFLVLMGMLFIQGMYDGWMRTARRQKEEWEIGAGHFEHSNYDKYDSFTFKDSFAKIPDHIQELIRQNEVVPILVFSGVLYPQGRMTPISIKGIPWDQALLKIPSQMLRVKDEYPGSLPTVIGQDMARTNGLSQGDLVSMRFKDARGVFNAYDIEIVKVMATPVSSIDESQVWIDFTVLNSLVALQNSATLFILKDEATQLNLGSNWRYISQKKSLEDVLAMMKADQAGGYVVIALLLFLAMIAIFDTQILAVFKRRKEIGTLIALGMTRRQIIRLFTYEGCLYMVFGTILTAILGLPLFIHLGTKGIPLPQELSNLNVGGFSETMKSYYDPLTILFMLIMVFVLTLFASWLPAAKIARMKATQALRGKV
ncbi:MAG: FtsX-like permease family protein [Candidatus Cloacimonadaceae bacterium]|jgi:ABC-type lipoprotein release transport system permease subunit|nr:FtsX-like permease family protein [Candidatus Cloacimonadota bacterium]MDY0126659.1 FtsX-like permease family protein [Candidatus Cloacimonadaceae bacterium]MCB5255553.1 FtsX-like permease family protein [Candidatus Cloacimonadota bacterium]MCK9177381.1 FtsX-like permease family protein [Candidatus Cloacimonadota bacterium]MCK9241820.1 FtsX-like permease family protein [Candidatus Cloacimonadota bacterium]